MLKSIKSSLVKAITTLCLVFFATLPMLSANAMPLQPIAGIGIQHQAEGAVKQGMGKAQEVTGDLKGKAAGMARQVDGKAKRDIGRVESQAEKLANNSKKTATGLGDQFKDAAGNLADSVKKLVD